MDYPQKTEIQKKAAEGSPITQPEASALASDETDMTGFGPIKGGTAATAQSIHDRQRNFTTTAGDLARKPPEEITKGDAADVQKKEARALGGVPPGRGSTSAYVQSMADHNARERGA
ncbi:hypothetical protein QBC33DRAFT_549620 [Phialemonium atrogriseum]|uniref:SMP domain-containing protein n=1 Tax=Phialemonium atrogriseum TaxID=1093897 RepID=A0AAJ0BUL9_9PEZI|nr:uncharacterized protein QBC33DRAFT_549620 [Phialemonium atrogriseum]KAK1763414.1 hypothetical protein QBC33DRAFT_549620 [Phialemonium atrogriseum]